MKTSILAIAVASLVSGAAFATQPVPTVTTVLNGSIDVGTYIGAAPGQHETQISVGSVTSYTTVSQGRQSYGERSGSSIVAPVITSSITGNASSKPSGNGFVLPSWTVAGHPASAIVGVAAHTTITNFPIPVTVITSGNGGHSSH